MKLKLKSLVDAASNGSVKDNEKESFFCVGYTQGVNSKHWLSSEAVNVQKF